MLDPEKDIDKGIDKELDGNNSNDFVKNKAIIFITIASITLFFLYVFTHSKLFIGLFFLTQFLYLASLIRGNWLQRINNKLFVSPAEAESSPNLTPENFFDNEQIDHAIQKVEAIPKMEAVKAPPTQNREPAQENQQKPGPGLVIYESNALMIKDLKIFFSGLADTLATEEGSVHRSPASAFTQDNLNNLMDNIDQSLGVDQPSNKNILKVEDYVSRIKDTMQAYVNLILNLSRQGIEAGRRVQEISHQIEGIFGLVDNVGAIADRTSLLALNAAIEAARSGQIGRSYTYVAKEVRKLSEQSEKFGKEIRREMEVARASVTHTKELVDSVAVSDLEAAISSKSNIDQALGRLNEIILSCQSGKQFKNFEDPEFLKLKARMTSIIDDVQRLLSVVFLKLKLLGNVDLFSAQGKRELSDLLVLLNSLLYIKIYYEIPDDTTTN